MAQGDLYHQFFLFEVIFSWLVVLIESYGDNSSQLAIVA